MDSARSRKRRWKVLDEPNALKKDSPLYALLRSYAEPGLLNRDAWQDRVMELEGLSGRDLSRLHGELIALGWIEQNTGITPSVRANSALGCYRVTSIGLRVYRHVEREEDQDETQEQLESRH
jgi:hypothetical protein